MLNQPPQLMISFNRNTEYVICELKSLSHNQIIMYEGYVKLPTSTVANTDEHLSQISNTGMYQSSLRKIGKHFQI